MSLTVSEVFTTIQGEGPSTGVPVTFVRLMGCNLACTWCDTPYTWDASRFDLSQEGTKMSPDDLFREIVSRPPRRVVISGGEPMLHKVKLGPLMSMLWNKRYKIEVETAGTISPTGIVRWVHRFNVSPKLESSGNPKDRRYKPDVLKELVNVGKSIFKFVVTKPTDIDEIDEIVRETGIPNRRVYLMPQGTTALEINDGMRELVPLAINRQYNVTTRLHVLLWGSKRGV